MNQNNKKTAQRSNDTVRPYNQMCILSVADQSVLAVRNVRQLLKQKGLSNSQADYEIKRDCFDADLLDQVYRANGFRLGK
jgi:hypothetical protein